MGAEGDKSWLPRASPAHDLLGRSDGPMAVQVFALLITLQSPISGPGPLRSCSIRRCAWAPRHLHPHPSLPLPAFSPNLPSPSTVSPSLLLPLSSWTVNHLCRLYFRLSLPPNLHVSSKICSVHPVLKINDLKTNLPTTLLVPQLLT